MKTTQALSLLPLFVLGLSGAPRAEDAEIRFKPISIAGQFDNGQVIQGEVDSTDRVQPGKKIHGDFFQRTGVWITQEATVKERLHLTVGVGGVFWYALPMSSDPVSKLTQFGPGISQAQGVYSFGDLKNPVARLQMGFFPYKYNSDAKNMGEYLLRCGTYPGYLVSGGWNMVSSAAYMVQGMRLNLSLWGGKFQSDFIMPMEHDIPPMFGFSPTYVANVKPVAGIEIGAGIACNHCLPIRPSLESPRIPENQIILRDSVVLDTLNNQYVYNRIKDTTSYYTFQGLKVMGRISLDPKAFLPMGFLGPEDLKIYSELAVLGWKDYSYLYNKKSERMPIMVGFNLPTFRLLDVFSFELEHYNSKFLNNIQNPVYNQLPTWYLLQDFTARALADNYSAKIKKDNWKWTVYAKKEVIKGAQIYAQIASDHIRTFQYNAGPQPALVPITNNNGKDWYYIIRLQFGI